jgi:hypothetical protein
MRKNLENILIKDNINPKFSVDNIKNKVAKIVHGKDTKFPLFVTV